MMGFFQEGLALVKGKSYRGRIWLAGKMHSGPLEVRLVWGDSPEARQVLRIEKIKPEFTCFPLSFTPGVNSSSARLEIVALGQGKIRVGPVSLMPADNIKGMRSDVLVLLKELNSPIYRWPGGNFVSGYDWRDGLGDPDRRPTRKNPAWQGIEPNDFGMNEYIAFCREIGTEPLITVNTGFGDAYSAAAEVEYANGGTETPMGALRAKNGAPEPFKVKYWCVGNEMWGPWQLGFMSLDHYVRKHNWVVDKMREVDPNIVTFASGSIETRSGKRSWSEGLLTDCRGHMDYLAEHFYVGAKPDLLQHVRQCADRVRAKAKELHQLKARLKMTDSPIRLAMTEWNYWYGPEIFGEIGPRYFLKDGLGVAAGLHEFYRNSDVYFMANYAQTVNVIGCIKASKTAAAMETTGLALTLYRRHFGEVPLKVEADLGPVDVAAALSRDGKTLTVGVVNPTKEEQSFSLSCRGIERSGPGRRIGFGGNNPMAFNDPDRPPVFKLVEDKIATDGPLTVKPYSVGVFVLPLR
jgi:alpha-N-arabinofuranosidase